MEKLNSAFLICMEDGSGYRPLNENGEPENTLTFFQQDELKEKIHEFTTEGEHVDVKVFEVTEIELCHSEFLDCNECVDGLYFKRIKIEGE